MSRAVPCFLKKRAQISLSHTKSLLSAATMRRFYLAQMIAENISPAKTVFSHITEGLTATGIYPLIWNSAKK
jgi:hypothetical protein